MNHQIQPEVSKDIIIEHTINHNSTWQHTFTMHRMNEIYIDVVLLHQIHKMLPKFTKCI